MDRPCRYHYNVSAERLSSHVDKGFSEGLRITAVASCKGLWAVIMDASNKQKDQVHAPPGLSASHCIGTCAAHPFTDCLASNVLRYTLPYLYLA